LGGVGWLGLVFFWFFYKNMVVKMVHGGAWVFQKTALSNPSCKLPLQLVLFVILAESVHPADGRDSGFALVERTDSARMTKSGLL
jgi:hypothetical protein